jgi:hypothetical protein
MKTQISRDGFRPDQRYSGVYQQQGRMLTDRDWNEMVDVLRSRIDDGLADALGTGLPRGRELQLVPNATGAPTYSPGLVWAGGMAARISSVNGPQAFFGYSQQADFPSPPPTPVGQSYILYADLWERPVLALEDSDLRDPALTGPYDTATRRRTIGQIKWAPLDRDPENSAHNPTRGNALLSARIPAAAPAVDPVGGNFLLRVEVHDVTWPTGAAPDAPSSVVVKWSRENGARHFRYPEAPPAFLDGKWVWEVWKPIAELHLGYAFGIWTPARGALSTQASAVTGDAGSFIRRWDGYCVLHQANGTWSLSAAGSADDPAKTAPGAQVSIQGGVLTVTYDKNALQLSLNLQGRTFLAGDAWTVPVRRAVHLPGGPDIVAAVPPSGVTHRYVTLGTVTFPNIVTVPQRRVPFPIVSRLGAEDVDYDGTGSQNGLFNATHDTVDKALDRLWQLGAEHLAYRPTGTSVYQGKTVTQARQALNLLADVHATSVIYENRQGMPDVQSAAAALFARTFRPSAWTTVGATGQFPTVAAAIQRLRADGKTDVRLWLLPGDHELPPTMTPDGSPDVDHPAGTDDTPPLPMHLTFAGAGWETRLLLRGDVTLQDCLSVTFRGLAVESAEGSFLRVVGGEVSFLDTRISGISKLGLIQISGASRVLMRDNIVEATAEDPTQTPASILAPLSSEAVLSRIFATRSPRLFALRVSDLVGELQGLSATSRTARLNLIQANLNQRGLQQDSSYSKLVSNLRTSVGTYLIGALAGIRAEAVQRATAGVFLILEDPVPTRLESNQIFGTLSLYGQPDGELSNADLRNIRARINAVTFDPTAGQDLVARNNRISGFLVAGSRLNQIRAQTNFAPLFRRLVLSNNTIDNDANQLFACTVSIHGNLLPPGTFGWTLGEQLLFVGNTTPTTAIVELAAQAFAVTGQSSRITLNAGGAVQMS